MANKPPNKEPTYVRIARANRASIDRVIGIINMVTKLELTEADSYSTHLYRIRAEMGTSRGIYFYSRLKLKGY